MVADLGETRGFQQAGQGFARVQAFRIELVGEDAAAPMRRFPFLQKMLA